ncbi:MAG TPA: tripartite tricarboxylate transporter substrate binding protein [Burkholderiales bacterium]|jgi:tripartite-type tricarboxylate transporter receptor subunit TctC
MKRILLKSLLALAAVAAAAGGALAADKEPAYPSRPIRIVVPFTAGSATDIIARVVSPRMADRWGRPVVVDNRPSAGGIIAFGIVAEAAPDAHTLLVTGSNFSGSAALYAGKLPFDPVKDFSGITQFATTPLVLVVGPGLGVKSVKELIALAQEKKGQLNFASTGLGSGPHYGAELFKLAAGIGAVHVPYRGSPETLTDVMSGRVHFLLSPVLAASPLVRSGRVVALGVTTPYRAQALPDVPTIAEAGLPGFVYQGWYGMLTQGRTPRKTVNLLSEEVGKILDMPEVRERIAKQGAAAQRSSPEAFDKLVRDEIVTRTRVWKAAGVKIE